MSGSVRTGLDYNAAQSVAACYSVPWNEWTLEKLQACEGVILEQQNKELQAAQDAQKT